MTVLEVNSTVIHTQDDGPRLRGEYLHCDLVGPLLTSRGGSRYVAVYGDASSRQIWCKMLKDKTGNYDAMEEVFVDATARSGRPVRFFKTDGDGIFTGERALAIYAKYKIRHIQSAPGDSASNDVAERTIRTVMELTRTNLLHSGAPPNMWAEAMCMICFVWNNMPICPNPLQPGSFLSRTALLEGHSRKYNLDNLRAFGTKCHWMLTVEKKGGRKDAVGPKARLGAIVGIEDNMAAYRVYSFESKTILRIPFSQVVTHEGHFPFRNMERWSSEEKELPDSFLPSLEAMSDPEEWGRFGFSEFEELEFFS